MTDIYTFVGGCMKKIRVKQKTARKTVAEKLGITPNHLSEYESGKRRASLEFLARWTEAIGVNHRYPLEKWNQYLRNAQNPQPND